VACHHYASYHSESNFRFPDQFIPERWLDAAVGFEGDHKDVLQPFSLGPRACIGKQYVSSLYIKLSFVTDLLILNVLSLANCEIRLILCKLLFNFDLTLHSESINWADQKVYYLWDKPPLMVSLKDRFPNAKVLTSKEPLTLFSG
jgi:cytochrome P450